MATETLDQPATLPILSHWIGGRPAEVTAEGTAPVHNPATGQLIARVPRGGRVEVERAVEAAAAAFLAMRGEDGIRFLTRQTMVTERWPQPGREGPLSLVFPGNN